MSDVPTSAVEAERRADAVRQDFARTIDQLGEKLRPARIKQDAFAAVHDRTPTWLISYWRFARSPSGLALACAIGASVASTMFARQHPSRRYRR